MSELDDSGLEVEVPYTPKKCPRCNYMRQKDDTAPEWQCPRCQVAYDKASRAPGGGATYNGGTPDFEQLLRKAVKILAVALVLGGIAYYASLLAAKNKAARQTAEATAQAAAEARSIREAAEAAKQARTAGQKDAPIVQQRVLIFTEDGCPNCDKLREFLQERYVRFNELRVDESPEARKLYKGRGAPGLPLLVVDNDQLAGFSREAAASLLRDHNLPEKL